MKRIYIICEGQTEETFSGAATTRDDAQGHRAHPNTCRANLGIRRQHQIERIVTDARNLLLGDRAAYCTTFVDFYRIDSNSRRAKRLRRTIDEKARIQEEMKSIYGKWSAGTLSSASSLMSRCTIEGFSSVNQKPSHRYLPRRSARHSKGFEQTSAHRKTSTTVLSAPSERLIGLMPEYESYLWFTCRLRDRSGENPH